MIKTSITSEVETASLAAMIAELRAEVTRLRDRQEINDLYIRYMRGIDRLDEELHNGAYWPDAQLNYRAGTSTIAETWQMHATVFPNGALASWAHLLSNLTLDIDGDVAHVESYVTGMGMPKEENSANLYGIWGGRYVDRLERRGGEWRIAVREFIPHFRMKGDMDPNWTGIGEKYPYSCIHNKRDLSYVRPLNRRTSNEREG